MLNSTFLFMNLSGLEIIAIMLLLLLPFFLIIWAIIDLTKSNFEDNTNKVVWAVFIIFMPLIGAFVYLASGRTKRVS